MKYSELTTEQKNAVLYAMTLALYSRVRELMINTEIERGVKGGYGTTVMNRNDRLMNRLMADLLISDNGIPFHDTEARSWMRDRLDETPVTNDYETLKRKQDEKLNQNGTERASFYG